MSEEESEDEDPGTVLRQDPGSGQQVDKGSTVKLVVAKAPPDVEVPDVVDQQRDDAEQALKDAGFEVRVREETVDTIDQDGTVISQDPADGEERPKGSRVTIVVGKFEPPLNPEPTATPERDADAGADAVRVAVVCGGRSSEHDVSLNSGASVREGVAAAGHEVLDVRIARSGAWQHDGATLAFEPGTGLLGADAVFPVLHGPFGEDGTVQGLLELLDVPYVGAGVLASSLCMDKVVFKEVLAAAGVPQVGYAAVRQPEWQTDPYGVRERLDALGLPLFVKPARLGSSVGIVKVTEADEIDGALETAFGHDGLVIVEAFSGGMEVECSVLGLAEPDASLPGEIVLTGGADWYDYEAKYEPGGMELVVPARISDAAAEEVRRLARETFVRVGCAGLARVDFFVEGERVLVNELNTLPGFTATSVYPKLWEATGVPFPELCDRLLRTALDRFRAERGGHAF